MPSKVPPTLRRFRGLWARKKCNPVRSVFSDRRLIRGVVRAAIASIVPYMPSGDIFHWVRRASADELSRGGNGPRRDSARPLLLSVAIALSFSRPCSGSPDRAMAPSNHLRVSTGCLRRPRSCSRGRLFPITGSWSARSSASELSAQPQRRPEVSPKFGETMRRLPSRDAAP
jgi:hypothetical protein